uniref:Uncharacterized protein n=1 Tax=Anguilla anguilla TaxID=7936 RepID=A0A0E9XU96_ANGAN
MGLLSVDGFLHHSYSPGRFFPHLHLPAVFP